MREKVTLRINGSEVQVAKGNTILQAAAGLGIRIPTLCNQEDLCVAGNCRICVVEVAGSRLLPAACATPVAEGMEVLTNSLKIRQARKHIIELLYSEHHGDCATCYKSGNCELQILMHEYIIESTNLISLSAGQKADRSSPAIVRDKGKCVRCQRCVRACDEIQSVGVLTAAHKGREMQIETCYDKPLHDVYCTYCGQCVVHCPTGALVEKNYIEQVWASIGDSKKHVVVQTAPAVRVALGEALGLKPGISVRGKMVTALRAIGFDSVFDTNFAADLTVIEEGHELLGRLRSALSGKTAVLPMISSCSPGWVKFIEHLYPEKLGHLSSCKSPQQMFGAIAKTYYCEKSGINAADMVVVSVMPCTAKKFEASRAEMQASGYQDVDYVLTTRELALMIEQAGVTFENLEETECDSLLGEHSGAGAIFGVTGGVMEAALRTVWELITGKEIPFTNLDVSPVRGMEGIKELSLMVQEPKESIYDGVELRFAVAHGLRNANTIMEAIQAGNSPYHFVEIMACPGGCLGGGGQPLPAALEILERRARALYAEDRNRSFRKSHDNPEIIRLYKEFLGEPLGKRSHQLLHTIYSKRGMG